MPESAPAYVPRRQKIAPKNDGANWETNTNETKPMENREEDVIKYL